MKTAASPLEALGLVVEAIDAAGTEYSESGERALNRALTALGISPESEFGIDWETLYGFGWNTTGLRVKVGDRFVDLVPVPKPAQ
jgi:hypothetical protein